MVWSLYSFFLFVRWERIVYIGYMIVVCDDVWFFSCKSVVFIVSYFICKILINGYGGVYVGLVQVGLLLVDQYVLDCGGVYVLFCLVFVEVEGFVCIVYFWGVGIGIFGVVIK